MNLGVRYFGDDASKQESKPALFKRRSNEQEPQKQIKPSLKPKVPRKPDSQTYLENQVKGSGKQEQLDKWLGMTNNQIIQECINLKITPKNSHIENIQQLLNHIKKKEQEEKQDQQQIDVEKPNQRPYQTSQKRILFQRQEQRRDQIRSLSVDKEESEEKIEKIELERYKFDLSMIIGNQNKQEDLKHFENVNLERSFDAENQLINEVFSLKSEQLDEYFRKQLLKSEQNCSALNLNFDEFSVLPPISKKKVLKNLITLNYQTSLDPVKYILTESLEEYIINAQNSKELLDQKQKQGLNDKLQELQIYALSETQLQNNNFVLSLLKLLDNNKEVIHSPLIQQIINHFSHKNEQVLRYESVDQTIAIAKIINQLSRFIEDPLVLNNKIKQVYYNNITKQITRHVLKNLGFYDKFELLKALPQVHSQEFTSYKSLHYKVLNEILRNESKYFSLLNKETLFELVEKFQGMNKNRDLNNKLRANLLNALMYNLSLDDFKKLFTILGEGKENRIDMNLVVQQLFRRNLKLFTSINNAQDFKEVLDLLIFLNDTNPLTFDKSIQEIKVILRNSTEIAKRVKVQLEDMVRLANFIIQAIYEPDFFFKEILETEYQSFKYDVNQNITKQLVHNICDRVIDNEAKFEHLQLSLSKIHRQFQPYTERTFLLLQRILEDLIEAEVPLTYQELEIVTKMLQCEPIVMKLFRNSDQAMKYINHILESYRKLFQKEQAQQIQEGGNTEIMTPESWKDLFNSIANIHSIVSFSGDLIEKSEQVAQMGLELLNSHLLKNQISLSDIFMLNKSLLRVGSVFDNLLKYYEEQTVIAETMQRCLEYSFLNQRPFFSKFHKQKKNIKLIKQMQDELNNTTLNKNMASFLSYLNHTNSNNHKNLAIALVQNMSNGRSLIGDDLKKLFLVIEKYNILDHCQELVATVACNLQTIEPSKIQLKYEQDKFDEQFQSQQAILNQQDQDLKMMILSQYQKINQKNSSVLKQSHIVLAPLSSLISDIFDNFDTDQVMKSLEILGSDKFENYSEKFISKLYEQYSNLTAFKSMLQEDPKYFLKFAHLWPHFLKNNALLNSLVQIKASKVLVQNQSEILQILTKKNVIHEELIQTHFDTFIKMKDREQVAQYLDKFLASCSHLGYAKFDIEKMTQVLRRIYKEPEEVQISMLLNYFVVLALSQEDYKGFDKKSSTFIENALNLIEEKYSGLHHLDIKVLNKITGDYDKVKVNYYESILTNDKTYNKVLVKGDQPSLDFKKAMEELDYTSMSEDESSEQSESEQLEVKEEEGVQEEQRAAEGVDFILAEPQTSEDIDKQVKQELQDLSDQEQDVVKQNKIEKKIYERKAGDSQYSEELEFHKYRKRKLENLDGKSKHLLLFSNVNQLNFTDINQSEVVKAWVTLFNFRSKSFDSMIFEEFITITMRNSRGKAKSHWLFLKFLNILRQNYGGEINTKFPLNIKCEKTGWPIDIAIQDLKQPKTTLQVIQFFLQEEICLNVKTNTQEPLALQKLMLQHLKTLGRYKVMYVIENEFYGKDKKEEKQVIDKLMGVNTENFNQQL